MHRLFFLLVFGCCSLISWGQKNKKKVEPVANASNAWSTDLFSSLQYRLVGPWRGGRSAAVAGSYKQKQTFFMGATGGGVWKTTDGGSNWRNISDGFFGSSIGAVAIAPSDEQIIYVGEGENTMRGNVSEGLGGMWRSDDGGKTWRNLGLQDSRHIIRIVIHPRNPDILWVAAMGHLFGPNEERGVFKSTDGGKTWKKTLYVNNQTGASDLVMEPGNPNTFYAGTWRVIRTPYSLESGGEGSGLWKSTDGGETWKNISQSKGLPKNVWGIVGVAVAPSNTDKVYALIENKDGGLYMSTDGGQKWTLQSNNNDIRQRAWYYTKVFVDPQNENKVYCPNVGFMVSNDGGKNFRSLPTPHGDHHDLWIDPENGNRMVVGDDGGAQVSFDAGTNWSTYENQPTAQFYRVSTDQSFPYRILTAQQDNSTIRIKSRTYGNSISDRDWEETAGGESGYVVADPLNADIVYGGSYGGYLTRLDHKTGENRSVFVWPDNPMGAGADVQRYRFQWNFPIFFSPHDPKKLYCAGNVLFSTNNEGQSWKALSPDLTTNDKTKQKSSGGPITQDNTSVEYYCTIFTATESWVEKDLLWTGSDDGLIHVSRNGGAQWENVTPKDVPDHIMWNCVEVDPFKKGAAYFVGTRYKLDDYAPYIVKTEDYGKTWKRINSNIPAKHFTRALRADRKRPGLLYAGTEFGMYMSANDGQSWQPLQLNLPIVPITDLALKDNDLIVATQGRAIWVLDQLHLLQQYDANVKGQTLHVFNIPDSYRMLGNPFAGSFGTQVRNAGKNPPSGTIIDFYGANMSDTSQGSVTILDAQRKVVQTYSTQSKEQKLELTSGLNRFVWNQYYPAADKIDGMILWNGVPGPIKAAPGQYFARVRVGKDSVEKPFTVLADPNYSKMTQADYQAQQDFLLQVRDKFNEVQTGVKSCRSLRTQIQDYQTRVGKDIPASLKQACDTTVKQLTQIEEALYQTKAKSFQDVLNFPIRINDKLGSVFDAASTGVQAPTQPVREVYADLSRQADAQLNALKQLKEVEIPKLNQLIRDNRLPIIQ